MNKGLFSQHKLLKLVGTFLLGSFFLPLSLYGAPVHISVETPMGKAFGAGISAGNGRDCFVVAPLHVIEIALSIKITDRNGRSAPASRYQSPDGVDAILLKLEDGHGLDCPEDWNDGSAAEDSINDVEFLVSKKIKDGGIDQRRFFPGSITSTTISVQPFSSGAANRLIEGDSGSSLYARNQPLGMIVKVDTKTGEGEAIKQSQLHALFSSYILAQTAKVALITPVYYGAAENPYATVAVKDFVDERTPFDAMEMPPALAAANLQNVLRGMPEIYPDNVDYVINSKIIANNTRQEANPNYSNNSRKTSNLGQQMLNSLGSRDFRYYQISNIDVEVSIVMPKQKQQMTHIERLEYKTPMKDDVDLRQVALELPTKASVDALYATMVKYEMPVEAASAETTIDVASGLTELPAPAPEKKDTNVLTELLKLPR